MIDETIRLDKYLSSHGICSRRAVEQFLKENVVFVDDKRVFESGERINSHARVIVNDEAVETPTMVYYLLNKPMGIITTSSDEYGRQNVLSLIKTTERIFPVGRLDKDTHGLLLLTNDGELTNMLIHPRYHIAKTYELLIEKYITPKQIEQIKKGVTLEDGVTKPAEVTIIRQMADTSVLQITIHEGKKRQIRRMCAKLGIELVDLMRIQFGPLTLGELQTGEYRELTKEEVHILKNLNQK